MYYSHLHVSMYRRIKMPRNIEIKASVENLDQLVSRASDLTGTKGTEIIQHDTFFVTEKGRLKLREFKVIFLDHLNCSIICYDFPSFRKGMESWSTMTGLMLKDPNCQIIQRHLCLILMHWSRCWAWLLVWKVLLRRRGYSSFTNKLGFTLMRWMDLEVSWN